MVVEVVVVVLKCKVHPSTILLKDVLFTQKRGERVFGEVMGVVVWEGEVSEGGRKVSEGIRVLIGEGGVGEGGRERIGKLMVEA